METTRTTLLIRIKDPRDTQAWAEFYGLYAPLLYRYARARGLPHEDAEDVCSTCYESIVRQIPHFEYNQQKGGFKAWLRTMVHRRVIDLLRRKREVSAEPGELEGLAFDRSQADELWEAEWRRQHFQFCLSQVRELVTPQTYEIFRLLLEGHTTVADICRQLQVTANQVYKAKSRMIEMIRERLDALDSFE